MGTVIDHAIAIPALQEVVWQQLSAIHNNPLWQVDSEHVAFLTTHQNGRNTRWRSTMANGKECVIEITAWYEGLGYEYVIVDGVPYQDNRGRIRLQEVAEGTVVQWTFNYELSGALSGIRNSLRVRRQLDSDIVDSLRNLYSYIRSLSGEEEVDPSEVKSLMRDAPDVEERAQYIPRHPTNIDDDPSISAVSPSADASPPMSDSIFQPPAAQQPSFTIPEPPVADDDTQPNPRIQTGSIPPVPDLPPVQPTEDPFAPPSRTDAQKRNTFEFQSPFAGQRDQDDHEPFPFDFEDEPIESTANVAQSNTNPVAVQADTNSDISDGSDEEPSLFEIAQSRLESEASSRQDAVLEPTPIAEPEPSVEELAEAAPEPIQPSEAALTSPDNPVDAMRTQETPKLPEDGNIKATDTARMSVFEVFGLQKPSETQEMRQVELEAAQTIEDQLNEDDSTSAFFKSQTPIIPDVEPISGRVGLRARQRQHNARVRRPE